MANLARVRTVWSGSSVTGGGVSTFYFEEAGSGWIASLNTFWSAVAPFVPAGVTFQTQFTGDLIDVSTGEISGSWTDGASSSSVPGTGNAAYAAGTGVRVKWRTAGIVGGRRVVGSTFICPIINSLWNTSGQISAGTQGTLQTAANALVTASGHVLAIYSRPTPARPAGSAHPVIDATVPLDTSWLRSRRT